MNAKLGGVNELFDPEYLANHSIDNIQQPIMVVGVVNRQVNLSFTTSSELEEAQEEKMELEASLSAVLASKDVHFAAYNSAVCLQHRDPENMVVNIDKMLRQLLKEYSSTNKGLYPSRVILFRDGLRRAQFPRLLETEVADIKRMLLKIAPTGGEAIKLTFIVVQKRSASMSDAFNWSKNECTKRMQPFHTEVVFDEEVTDYDSDVFSLGGEAFFNRWVSDF